MSKQNKAIVRVAPVKRRGRAAPDPAGDDRLFRLLVQGVTDYAIFLLDANGFVTTWNPGAERIKGYTAGEIVGQHFSRFYTEEDRTARLPERALRTAADTGRFEHEGWRLRKDGSRFWASVIIDAIRDESGRLAGFAKIARDLTERRAAQRALQESEQRFRMLVQGVTDYAIFMLDLGGCITDWNAGSERIKGYREDEIIGAHFSQFYTEEDRAAGIPERGLALAARDGRYEAEGWRVRKDGSRFWAGAIIDAILDRQGTLIGFAQITRDLTERKRAEEALEETRAVLAQSQKMEAVGQLTGGIAHDFNNLLTVITNSLDLLSGEPSDRVQRRRIVDSAQRATERAAGLTQQLLAFSRRQALRPAVYDINDLIGGFEAVLRRACPEPIEVEVSPAAVSPVANIDAPQFETALLNLVVNARDAMPRGGVLRIATGRVAVNARQARAMSEIAPGDYVTVRVSDTGQGMPPAVLTRAFEPFFTTKGVGKGSGLGLSQVYGFVAQSGGHVAIESEPDAGTSVTLYLPAANSVAEGAESGGVAARRVAVGRVLVVEDDPEVLDVTVECLRTMGYDVLTAPDGPSALAVLRRDTKIDILFCDVVMPRGMNGVELARTAVQLRPRLRILLASGYAMTALSADPGIAATGEFPFLSKPYRRAELAEALQALRR